MSTPTEANPSLGPLMPLYNTSTGQTNIAWDADPSTIATDAEGVTHGKAFISGSFSSTPPAGVVSSVNSSATPLTANAVFTGTSESLLAYGSISVQAYSDVASAAGGLIIEQSQDGTNWDTKASYSVAAATPFQATVNATGQFLRTVYTNGAGNQTVFRLQTIKEINASPSAGVANQRVNAQSGDFVAGSIVDLATVAGAISANKMQVAGTVNTLHGSAVDASNSSTSVLAANAVFTGAWVSALNYSAITVEVYSDHASSAGGLQIEQSQDGTNADTIDAFSVSAATGFQTTINLTGQYYRIVYTNGATLQTVFRLQTIKETSEVVLPRTLTALGNLKVAIEEDGTAGLATSANQTTGNTSLGTIATDMAELLTDTDNLANIPAKGSAAMAGSTPVTIATNDTVLSELLSDTDNLATIQTNTANIPAKGAATTSASTPVNIASDQVVPSNTKQINGTTTSVNAGNRDGGTQRFIEAGNGTGTVTQVASSASSGVILAANANKKGTLFYNDSTQILYLLYGTGTASPTNYSVKIGSQAYFEDPLHYTGGFNGIWAAANGFVYCTEVS